MIISILKENRWIPYKCSRKGPYYASGDINGDGKRIFLLAVLQELK
jgi:hypothetical protein